MKIFFKNFFIFSIIIYFILSIGVTIFNFSVYNNELSSLDIIPNSNMHTETIEIPTNIDISDFFTIEYLHGKSEILYQNLFLILLSIILGFSISIIIKIKETSKIKYVYYFIFGYIIYSVLILFISYFYIDFTINNFFIILFEILKKTLPVYIISFILIFILNLLITKFQVNKLNNKLKQIDKDSKN